jgi:hypothetical protein
MEHQMVSIGAFSSSRTPFIGVHTFFRSIQFQHRYFLSVVSTTQPKATINAEYQGLTAQQITKTIHDQISDGLLLVTSTIQKYDQ